MIISNCDKMLIHRIEPVCPVSPINNNRKETNFNNSHKEKKDNENNFSEIFKRETDKLI